MSKVEQRPPRQLLLVSSKTLEVRGASEPTAAKRNKLFEKCRAEGFRKSVRKFDLL